jgi:hypothetical protein
MLYTQSSSKKEKKNVIYAHQDVVFEALEGRGCNFYSKSHEEELKKAERSDSRRFGDVCLGAENLMIGFYQVYFRSGVGGPLPLEG